MKVAIVYNVSVLAGTLALLFVTTLAAPVEEDEQSENALAARAEASESEYGAPWDQLNTAALRKLLLQLDSDDRMSRVSRSWPAADTRWSPRDLNGRLMRPWRTDKRQVRFRQCYFNPISCFRK